MKSINPGLPPASSAWTADIVPQAWEKSRPGCCGKQGAEHHSRDAGLGQTGWTRAETSSAPLPQDPTPCLAPLALRPACFALLSCGHQVGNGERWWVCEGACNGWGRWGGGRRRPRRPGVTVGRTVGMAVQGTGHKSASNQALPVLTPAWILIYC